ncbi:MAG: cell filamentation protein Fic [Verrucomicrobia bacterium 61-8]|nr:Fic family protein [Verrucomicrobiota bacterium]OJV02100.1 MAG: cell filamentation protein Fic [Verrucomicrobia bacterium 61-8]
MPAETSWNWQLPDWPSFRFDPSALAPLEAEFLRQSGVFIGTVRHVSDPERLQLFVDLIGDEALHTSEIEGEVLNRASLQSSLRRHFGLATDQRTVPPAEQGIADMMVDLYRRFEAPLANGDLFHWHALLMSGRADLAASGAYRQGGDPMQIVSRGKRGERVHFEAPPSAQVPQEMERFIAWFNDSRQLPALTRAALAHWHFVSIHPFEDGNGRLARALAEKALWQGMHQPVLIALSRTIAAGRRQYYDVLELGNRTNDVSAWMQYFAQTALDAQRSAQADVDFLIEKTRFFDRLRDQLNPRQEKALLRMFRAGPAGFQGGLSAENYISLTGTSRATATRDLVDLVEKHALIRTGELKGARYHLALPSTPGGSEQTS